MCSCNNRRGFGFFQGYQSFWIIVVIAIVVIWVHYFTNNNGCGCNNCLENVQDDTCGCYNNCNSCNSCGTCC